MSSKILAVVGLGLLAMTAACSSSVEGNGKGGGGGWGASTGTNEEPSTSTKSPFDAPSTSKQCAVDGQSSQCTTCMARSCCNEILACDGNQQCGALKSCVGQCGQDESCMQECVQQNPGGKEPLLAVLSCLDNKCGQACQ